MSKSEHPACPSDDLLVAWHDDEAGALLDSAHAATLRAHVAGCAYCGARLAALSALEADLLSLNLADRPAGADFTQRVLRAVPAPVAPVPARRAALAGLADWWHRQAAAVTLVVMGLLIMLVTGDAFALLGDWWQQANDWVNTASASDASGVGTLLTTLPSGSAAPEAQLGLVVGAIILALGAAVFMFKALSTQEPPRTMRNRAMHNA